MGSGPINHGYSRELLYGVWLSMRNRCHNKFVEKYADYGGKGIEVCPEWRASYLPFRRWAMENGYRHGLQIDRIDNTGNYTPANCRWVTAQQQQNNRSNTKFIEAFGERKSRADWVRDPRCQVNFATLRARLKRGWPTEKAITQPLSN